MRLLSYLLATLPLATLTLSQPTDFIIPDVLTTPQPVDTTTTQINWDPYVGVVVTPATVMSPTDTLTLKGISYTARVVDDGCKASHQWSFLSAPNGAAPTFTAPNDDITTCAGMTISGPYIIQVMAIDQCSGANSTLKWTQRVTGGTYDSAIVRAAVDDFGGFVHNGTTTARVNGFVDSDMLTIQLPKVLPGDVFALTGFNLAQPEGSPGPNPAGMVATIRWRDTDISTSAAWKCIGANLTQLTGSNAWMKPGWNDAILANAVVQASNRNDTPWAGSNGGKPLNAAADAGIIWFENTLAYKAQEESSAWCRYVFNPPAAVTTGDKLVLSAGFINPPPTQRPPATLAPTLPPTDAPTDTPVVTTPTDPNTGATLQPTVPPTTINAGAGTTTTTTTEKSSSFNILFVIIPIVVVAILALLIGIYIYKKNHSTTNKSRASSASRLTTPMAITTPFEAFSGSNTLHTQV